MPKAIKITAGAVQIDAVLNDKPTAKLIAGALPIKACGLRWGGEIYFTIPVKAGLEPGSRDVLEAGELGYWPAGAAFCIFFGPTPASQGNEIRAASDVNVIGKIKGDFSKLWNVSDAVEVIVEAG